MGKRRRISREVSEPAPVSTETVAPARRGLPIEQWGIWLSLAAFCAAPLVSLALIFPFVDNIPKWDQWSLIELWEAHFEGRPVRSLLLAPYNGHLNIVPRLLFYVLGLATHWNLRAEVLASYLFALLTAAALLLMLRDSGKELLLLAAPAAGLVFSLNQFENYLSGYPLGQVLSQCALTVALCVLTRPRITAWHAVGGMLAALVATFSWGAGLVAWPLGLLALALRPGGRRLVIPWVAVTLVCGYLVKRGAVGGASLLVGLRDFDTAFCFALLGRPLSYRAFPAFTVAVGCGFLLVLAFVLLLEQTLRARQWLLALRWGLLGASALGAAVLVSLGRAAAGPGQALASHYSTATYPLLLAVLALAGRRLLDWRATAASRLQRAAVAVLGAALLAVPLWVIQAQSRETFLIIRMWEEASQEIDRKLLAGTVSDDEIRRSLHPNTALVRRGTAFLREHRLAFGRYNP
jgi:hypothetical protein